MSISYDVSALLDLGGSFAVGAVRAGQRANTLVRAVAIRVEADAKAAAPVDTGNLRNGIHARILAGGLQAEVAPTAEYAEYVEFGTSRMSPQPFMGPAGDRNRPALEQGAAQIATEALGG